MGMAGAQSDPEQLLPLWRAAWQPALEVWSRFTKLNEPRWLLSRADEKREGLSGSFAMIRLDDHAILVSLRQVAEQGLGDFAREVLAHEIGHHVLAPADLADNARLLARLRAALPGLTRFAPFVGNLYTDLLINDRLTRAEGLDLPGLYRALRGDQQPSALWNLYMRIYEQLWSLQAGTLSTPPITPELQADAGLGARILRVYGRDWLEGAGRFAALLYPYLAQEKDGAKTFASLLDVLEAGAGEVIPDGLAEMDEDEVTDVLHPRDDPELSGIDLPSDEPGAMENPEQARPEGRGGRKRRYRRPADYTALMKATGVKVDEKRLLMRYYRELARRHLIPFPQRQVPRASDPLPEGLDPWDTGEPIASVDWLESVSRSPTVIPGITTLQRSFGSTEGSDPERQPLDLYLGIDCSGSMVNPALQLSYPVLAGTVVALSALRAGARAMACLSGEPGEFDQTEGLVRSESAILRLLTGYLGTGYAFGAGRLKQSILDAPPPKRPLHILVISDADWFYMLNQFPDGWQVAEQAVHKAGGGATAVLNMPYRQGGAEKQAIKRLQSIGWRVALVSSEAELLDFARAFARATYHREARP
ncbi:MAG: VWA domain-containing protein [Gammaproteobacteria bacterium]|nr:VWA domain-containing protein [Gammaproteobacteria bacterium]